MYFSHSSVAQLDWTLQGLLRSHRLWLVSCFLFIFVFLFVGLLMIVRKCYHRGSNWGSSTRGTALTRYVFIGCCDSGNNPDSNAWRITYWRKYIWTPLKIEPGLVMWWSIFFFSSIFPATVARMTETFEACWSLRSAHSLYRSWTAQSFRVKFAEKDAFFFNVNTHFFVYTLTVDAFVSIKWSHTYFISTHLHIRSETFKPLL